MKILVVATGGTFGSQKSANGLVAKAECYTSELVNLAKRHFNTKMDISFASPFTKLSENISPTDWKEIGACIQRQANEADGIVVLHGTDTMAYSAAAISYLNVVARYKPIVFTGSNLPIQSINSDAGNNFIKALSAAENFADEAIYGTFIVFNGTNDFNNPATIHLGTRVKKASCDGQCYRSYNLDDHKTQIGFVTNENKIVLDNEAYTKLLSGVKRDYPVNFSFAPDKVFALKLYPGMSPNIIAHLADTGIKSIILEVYNSGTGPADDTCFSLVGAIKYARMKGVGIFAVSQHDGCGGATMNTYESSFFLKEAGVTPLNDMIWEAALPKLMLAHANYNEYLEIVEFMLTNIAGEISI